MVIDLSADKIQNFITAPDKKDILFSTFKKMLSDSDYFLLFLINAIWTKIDITWKIKLCLCREGFIDIIHGKRQSAKVILTIFPKYEVYVWLQLFPILCDTMDCSSPGSSVHGILQARILEWIAMPSSRRSSWPRDQTRGSCDSWIAGRFFTTEPLEEPKYEDTTLKRQEML